MMMTYEERSLDTDMVEALPGHVVTGVRLRKLGGHINLEVRVSSLKFRVSENLYAEESHLIEKRQ